MKISQWTTRLVIDIWKVVIKIPHLFQWKKRILEWIEANKYEYKNYKNYKHTELLAETKYSLYGILNIQEKLQIFDQSYKIWIFLRRNIEWLAENISQRFIHEIMASNNYGRNSHGSIKLVDYWRNLKEWKDNDYDPSSYLIEIKNALKWYKE